MLWIPFALFFWWLVYCEVKGPIGHYFGYAQTHSKAIFKEYLILLIILALAFSWPPFHHWHFQRFLTHVARELSQNSATIVHCNTLWDTLFDEPIGVAGHADPKTGYIVIQYPRCSQLMDYVRHPEKATLADEINLNILTHESMHARGEYDEGRTECQAVQRNYRAARLLGIPEGLAQKQAMDYYQTFYLHRRHDSYFSDQCAPGKQLDEHLFDSTWAQ
jgi:hypothetical protein